MPMPEAIAPITRNPAAMIGLDDRGAIAPGLRADLVRARDWSARRQRWSPSGARASGSHELAPPRPRRATPCPSS